MPTQNCLFRNKSSNTIIWRAFLSWHCQCKVLLLLSASLPDYASKGRQVGSSWNLRSYAHTRSTTGQLSAFHLRLQTPCIWASQPSEKAALSWENSAASPGHPELQGHLSISPKFWHCSFQLPHVPKAGWPNTTNASVGLSAITTSVRPPPLRIQQGGCDLPPAPTYPNS